MSRADKAQQFGPHPAPRETLGPAQGHQRVYHSNDPAPAQGTPDASPRHQLAMGQYVSPSRVPGHGVPELSHLEHGAPEPSAPVKLEMRSTHPANALYQDAHGRPPTASIEVVNSAEAATELGKPSDFRAAPQGMHGVPHRPEFGPAPLSPELSPATTPVRPGGPAAVPFDRTLGGGQLQRPSTWAILPEAARSFSTKAPGER